MRGDAFEEFCEVFLRLIPEYNIKNVWLQGALPVHIIKKLKLVGQKDHGIDLVAETIEGEIWAIQAKFRSNRKKNIFYRELSTFLAVTDKASYRLVISNTENLPEIVEKRGNFGGVLAPRLDTLDDEFFYRFNAYIQKRVLMPLQPLIPREHQEKAVQAAAIHFKKNNRGQLIMACGTGKTLTSIWISEKIQAKRILVIVPSLALMRQTVSVWARNYRGSSFKYLCVCSDASVAFESKSDYSIRGLEELDVPVTTEIFEARKHISSCLSKNLVVFSTYQSSDVLSKAVRNIKDFCFDIMICDEAHRTAGAAKSLFNLVLDDRYIMSSKRMFMTATPRIFAKHVIKRGIEEDVDLFSMSDESKYGKEFYRLSFGKAIEQQLLSDYKVIVAIVTDKDILEIIKTNKSIIDGSENFQEYNALNFAKQVAYIKAVSQYGIRHTISFHSRVSLAQAFVDGSQSIIAINQLVKDYDCNTPILDSFHVNGKMKAGNRNSILKEFTDSQFSVVSNARCLTEGVDIPSVDGVLFYDPKYTLTDIVQATGRALRTYKGKDFGYIIIPVMMKFEDNVDKSLDTSDFSQVWTVIKAMQSQDERLDEIISRLNSIRGEMVSLSNRANQDRLSQEQTKWKNRLSERIQIFNMPLTISTSELCSKIQTKIVDVLSGSWDYNFGLLKAYRQQNPDRWPGQHERYMNFALGAWLAAQKYLYNRSQLSTNRTKQMQDISYDFTFNSEWKQWSEMYDRLCKYIHDNPDRPFTRGYFTKDKQLGVWCSLMRLKKKEEKLSQDQIAKLKSLNFNWEDSSRVWFKTYEKLVKFRAAHPNRWPAFKESFDGYSLGRWYYSEKWKLNRGFLDEGKTELLNNLGITARNLSIKRSIREMNSRTRVSWEETFSLLCDYRNQFPNNWPLSIEEFCGSNLGYWCKKQRQLFGESRLNDECILKLQSINFPFELREDLWKYKYELLVQFKNEFNRWPRIVERYKNIKIGYWCMSQKAKYKRGELSLDKVQLFRQISFF
jgi:superfamily II DNA or RNA helicase